MKFFIYTILILLYSISSYKTQKLNYSYVNSEENEYDFDDGFNQFEELSRLSYNRRRYYENPIFDLNELMKQPILPGISDENWPYPEDEDPFSLYYRNGCKKCACGMKTKKRIVNGSLAKPDEFPWQVLITYKRRFNCGGSLINDKYVLTAGHCVQGYKKSNLELRFGAFKRKKRTAVYRQVAQVWIAKGFNMKNVRNDAAIMKLQTKIRITPTVRPICLPSGSSNYDGKIGTVTGWGAIYFNGPASEVLKKAQVPILSNKNCQKTGYREQIRPTHICAGNNGDDSCSGDSGGPLIISQGNKFHQIGIVSFGKGCNKPNYPGVYTRVTKFKNFIVKTASQGACWCKD